MKINDECWAFVKQLMLGLANITMRQLYTEIMALETVIAATKKASPHRAQAIDQCLAIARDNPDIRREVDKKVESIVKIVNSFDQSTRDQTFDELIRTYIQTGKEN
jgi:uncharacterized protein (DUF2236 family)